MSKVSSKHVLAVIVLAGLVRADTTPHDPTDPSQVVEKLPQSGRKNRGLAGPSIDPESLTHSDGQRRDMMADRVPSVEALLDAKCSHCHGALKQKAGIQVFPIEEIFTGNRRDWVVIPGVPEESILLQRIKLPAGHDDIMPPSGPPMTAIEIQQIEVWIRNGADATAAKEPGNLGMNAQTKAARRQTIRPREWLKEYLALALEPEQRSFAAKAAQEHQKASRRFQKQHGDSLKALQERIREATRLQQGPQLQKLRVQLASIRRDQPRFEPIQEKLWEKLTPSQQATLRKKLEKRSMKHTSDDVDSSNGRESQNQRVHNGTGESKRDGSK